MKAEFSYRYILELPKFEYSCLVGLYIQQGTRDETKFHLVTTFTKLWAREKKVFSFSHCVHYVMIKSKTFFLHFSSTFTMVTMVKRKRNWFLLHHYLDYTTIMKNYFLFHYCVQYASIFLHLTTLVTCRKSLQMIFSPENNA